MKRLVALLVLVCCLVGVPSFAAFQQKEQPKQTERQTKGNPDVKVWVNTASGVYHCPGTRWYGATKHGEYMTQKQAQDKGNRPAYGKYCQ